MKRIFIIVTFMLFAGITHGQSMDKGYLVGIHVFSLDLEPQVSFDTYKNFFTQHYITELNKNFPDVEHYFIMDNREDKNNEIGMMVIFRSQEIKDKYYQEDGSTTQLMKSIMDKVQPVRTKLDSLGKVSAKYTEWIIR